MVLNWLAGKHNKKINDLQKALESIAESEKCFLKMAARYREYAIEAESKEVCEGDLKQIVLSYQQRKGRCEEVAKEFADMQRPLLEELVLFELLKKKEIEALQDRALTTALKTRPFCLFF